LSSNTIVTRNRVGLESELVLRVIQRIPLASLPAIEPKGGFAHPLAHGLTANVFCRGKYMRGELLIPAYGEAPGGRRPKLG